MRSGHTNLRTLIATLVLMVGLGTSIVWVAGLIFQSHSVQAIPTPQGKCERNDPQFTTSTAPSQAIRGLSVTVNNGSVARTAIVQLSANVGVDTDAEVRVSYGVDGGPPQEHVFGPANLANHQEFEEARTVIALIPLSAGTHTITPFWRVSGSAGKNASIGIRCMTVETNTQ